MKKTIQNCGIDLILTGKKLRKYRRANHLSQDTLADRLWQMDLGVSRNSVSSWETGKKRPSIDHLIALSDLYGCLLDELIVRHQKSRDDGERDQLVPLIEKFKKITILITLVKNSE